VLGLIADNVRPKLSIWTKSVTVLAQALREIEDDGLGEEVELFRQSDERFASLRLHVRRIDDRKPPSCEPFSHDLVEEIEGVAGRRLIVLVIRNERPAEVRRDDFCQQKVLACERRFA
jgi:hypothetical protein